MKIVNTITVSMTKGDKKREKKKNNPEIMPILISSSLRRALESRLSLFSEDLNSMKLFPTRMGTR